MGAQCKEKGITLRAPTKGADISSLVHAPVGFSEEDLYAFLKSSNIDPSSFGHSGIKTLAEFSEELMKGESQLVRVDKGTEKERLCRVVELVLLRIAKPSGETLVEASKKTME